MDGTGVRSHVRWKGILLACLIGTCAFLTGLLPGGIPFAEPLLVALVAGIAVGTLLGPGSALRIDPRYVTGICIPLGAVFYGARNLNFLTVTGADPKLLYVVGAVAAAYFSSVLMLGALLKQRRQITYLTASGSAVCGASAIAITAPAVDADPDDVSISLVAVTLASFAGVYIICPFAGIVSEMTNKWYSVFASTVLQLTGAVKVAVQNPPLLPPEMAPRDAQALGSSVKALRYLILLVSIPALASAVRRKLYVPWFLWAFLAAGLVNTWEMMSNAAWYTRAVAPYVKYGNEISWSIALAAIGMAFGGMAAAIAAFYVIRAALY
ncbi:MAG TPA: putative sulfate exporter family transporter [bacterium]|nr:putative sulfate exporter family transporter [bacterium]